MDKKCVECQKKVENDGIYFTYLSYGYKTYVDCCTPACIQSHAARLKTTGCNAVYFVENVGWMVCGVSPLEEYLRERACSYCRLYVCPDCNPAFAGPHPACSIHLERPRPGIHLERKIVDATHSNGKVARAPGSMTKAAGRKSNK